jgi:chorismate mutase
MKVMVEVASAGHVREALKHGVDAVWIGARTTTNPFLVQEIASELSGSGIPVYVKNPVNPDLELWAGAVERLRGAGLSDITAIHRGFSFFGKSRYRNIPQWQVPLDFRGRFPDVPMLCDPSHIAGDRELVPEIAQKALDLDFDGLFIESHISPESALSDSQQQITPAELARLLAKLVIRQSSAPDGTMPRRIEILRSQIDVIDDNIVDLLAKRMEISAEIGRCKSESNIAVFQPDRWQKVLESVSSQAESLGLDQSAVREIFKIIHQQSIDRQREDF